MWAVLTGQTDWVCHIGTLTLCVEAVDDDEIAYFTVRWKTRASFVYRTKNIDNNDKDSKNRKRFH